ncbi:hypothetical protein [Dapis sp. BLCC M229]|uniref:hypothetical protein n=1 Tax=Dapis sp. BLCC M229 TaxID=3400188 RepID=UPI003CEC83CC
MGNIFRRRERQASENSPTRPDLLPAFRKNLNSKTEISPQNYNVIDMGNIFRRRERQASENSPTRPDLLPAFRKNLNSKTEISPKNYNVADIDIGNIFRWVEQQSWGKFPEFT